jgi:hypothetical protein
MAPRRGGGGGFSFGGSSSNTCPGAFSSEGDIAIFAAYCIFFVVTFGILITMGNLKKKNPHMKTLLTPLFTVMLWLELLGFALLILATVLGECDVLSYEGIFDMAIAYGIVFRLVHIILLYYVLVAVNAHLRRPLGHNPPVLKFIYGFLMGIVSGLLIAFIVLDSIRLASVSNFSLSRRRLTRRTMEVAVAYYAFFLIAVITAGVAIITSAIQLRSTTRTGALTLWGVILSFSMVVWVVFGLASYAATLDNTIWDYEVSVAFEYIIDFFQCLSFFAIIAIAKASVFANGPAPVDQPVYNQQAVPQYTQATAPQQQQYAYVQPPQQYPYHQSSQPQPQAMHQQQTPYQEQQQQFTQVQQPVEVHNGEVKHELKT